MLQTGIVPGNWSADNIDDHLREFEHIVYPRDAIHMSEVRATMLTSFGFGQKGGLRLRFIPNICIPSSLQMCIKNTVKESPNDNGKRIMRSWRDWWRIAFKAKHHSPCDSGDAALTKALLDPMLAPQTQTSSTSSRSTILLPLSLKIHLSSIQSSDCREAVRAAVFIGR